MAVGVDAAQRLQHHARAVDVAGGEARNEPDPHACRHERLHHAEVGEALEDAGAMAGRLLDVMQDALEGHAVRHADPRLVDDVGRGQVAAPGQPMPRRQADVERLHHERSDPQAPPAPGGATRQRVREHDVELAGEVGQVAGLNVHVGAGEDEARDAGQVRQRAGQEHLAGRGKRGQAHVSTRMVAELVPQRPGAFPGHGDIRSAARQREPGTGKHKTAPALRRERYARLPLEHLQLLRHRRGRAMRGRGDGRDASAFG